MVNARGVSDSAAVVVEVGGGVSELIFTASPDSIVSGASSTLAWSAQGARVVSIKDASGTAVDLKGQLAFGTVEVRPSRDAVYSLDVDGIVSQAKVTVTPTVLELSATPSFAKAGQTVKLQWKTAGGAKLTLSSALSGTLLTTTEATHVSLGSLDVVIPAGSPARGEITDVRNKGMWGKSGHFGARVLYATVNGRQIRLSGAFDDKGVAGGIGAVAVSAIIFLPAGFFMTGTSAMLPAGTIVKSFVDEDVPLAMPVVAQAPLQVGAPAAPLAVQPQR